MNANLTENASTLMDGATVYGHKAQASSYAFFFTGTFSGYVGDKSIEGYQETEEFKNVGRHVVSFYSSKLKKVVSVEILYRVSILNNGTIHSGYNVQQLMNLPVVKPSSGDTNLLRIRPPTEENMPDPPLIEN